MDADPSDVFAPKLDLAGMEAGPNADAQRFQSVPDGKCTPDGASGPVEGGQHAITGEFDQSAAMLIDDGSDHRVVTVEEAAPPMVSNRDGVFGRADDVGKEQRNAKLLLTLILGPFEHVNGLYVYPGQRRSSPRRLAKIFDYDQ